jgi:transglutaminase-like putative cysteine protease
MFLFIKHLTALSYSAPIAETVMELRMTPRNSAHQVLRGQRIDVSPHALSFEHSDWLGNKVHQFSILPGHQRVYILARSAVQTHPRVPETADLTEPVQASSDYRVLDFMRFSPLVTDCEALSALSERLQLADCSTIGAVLERIQTGLRDHISYEKGITTSATALPAVLAHGRGVCQDLAHVALGLCRRLGLPARYVSGYFYAKSGSELESHAWCEAYVGAMGWVPFDPTHKQVGSARHVAVAMGRDFSDVPPNRGVYRGDASETLTVRVSMQEVDELPEGLLSTAPAEIPEQGGDLTAPPGSHSEELDYQQAQQQQ